MLPRFVALLCSALYAHILLQSSVQTFKDRAFVHTRNLLTSVQQHLQNGWNGQIHPALSEPFKAPGARENIRTWAKWPPWPHKSMREEGREKIIDYTGYNTAHCHHQLLQWGDHPRNDDASLFNRLLHRALPLLSFFSVS